MDETNKTPQKRELHSARSDLEQAGRDLELARRRQRYLIFALSIACFGALLFILGYDEGTWISPLSAVGGLLVGVSSFIGLFHRGTSWDPIGKGLVLKRKERVDRNRRKLLELAPALRDAQHGLSDPEQGDDDKSGHLTVAEGGELSSPE